MESILRGRAEACEPHPVARAAVAVLLRNSHFQRRADQFIFKKIEGVLIVAGVVSSFYLKQLLQNLLSDLEDVRRVENRVTVAATGG